MVDNPSPRTRYGAAFWRVHNEAWERSDLNQREYCETQGIPLKAFGNWRAKFKAEPQPLTHKLLYKPAQPHSCAGSGCEGACDKPGDLGC